MNPLLPLLRALAEHSVRFVLIGVGGANHYAIGGQDEFITNDRDLFLPLEPENLERSWAACEAVGLELWIHDEPLDRPRDRWLAERIVERLAVTRATAPGDLIVDFTLVMAGLDFETVWNERRVFTLDDVDLPVARLLHIIQSKHAANRDKDRLFLATHKDALEQLLKKSDR